jgi:hypothetical protein
LFRQKRKICYCSSLAEVGACHDVFSETEEKDGNIKF